MIPEVWAFPTRSPPLPGSTPFVARSEPTPSFNPPYIPFLLPALLPTPSPSPSASTCDLDVVVVQLTTTLIIPNFHRYYDEPIGSFRPSYVSLPDGSLVASPLVEDAKEAATLLLLLGAYVMLIVRNIFISSGYLRRMKVEKKGLFYILFASQVMALAPWTTWVLGFFSQTVDCTMILRISSFFTQFCCWLLLSGAFGTKAYRCLNNSPFVLVLLGALQAASTTLEAIDLVRIKGVRRLSGSCVRGNGPGLLPIVMIMTFVQASSVCCCFIYAVWRSSRLTAAQGRISYRASTAAETKEEVVKSPPVSRGWWDHVPQPARPDDTEENPQREDQSPGALSRLMSLVGMKRNRLWRSSLFGLGMGTRVQLFREVMRDELCYTTFIVAVTVVSAVVAIVGASHHIFWMGTGWTIFNLAISSVLTVHSFGRVVRRHEQEAIVRDPWSWDTKLYVDASASNRHRTRPSLRGRARESISQTSVSVPPDGFINFPQMAVRRTSHRESFQSDASDQVLISRVSE
ncbi:hypothetical protein BC834DRAFT_848964 [Gloeopeniophorella convolvens]|nr:hypothetical protein BC834DRAFT_848964 [Gloeopeniophorella convolvens]